MVGRDENTGKFYKGFWIKPGVKRPQHYHVRHPDYVKCTLHQEYFTSILEAQRGIERWLALNKYPRVTELNYESQLRRNYTDEEILEIKKKREEMLKRRERNNQRRLKKEQANAEASAERGD